MNAFVVVGALFRPVPAVTGTGHTVRSRFVYEEKTR
jgi:hypothetical protein